MGQRIYRPRAEEGTFEIDLAPMLAMMVTLIPILLLSVTFVRVTVIESSIPQVVAQAIEKDKNKKDRSVNISLEVRNDKTLKIKVVNRGKQSIQTVTPTSQEISLDKLSEKLANLKRNHPEVYSISLSPGEDVSYKDLVKVMDATRTSKTQKFIVVDPKTKEKVQHNQMFPNVVFANVVEG